MKNKDLISLLNRAMAALETPADLSAEEKQHVIEDLLFATHELDNDTKVEEPLTAKGSLGNTYRQMKEALHLMNDEQLDCNISVQEDDEFYTADFRIVEEDSGVLDDNHPVIFLS